MLWKALFCSLLLLVGTNTLSASPTQELAAQCFFTPPEGWEIADPSKLPGHVKISFYKKNSQCGFCPSINLAIEETSASLSEYLKAIKAIHEQDRTNRWRALGKVRTAAGLAQLTEIDSTTEWGPVRILQIILLKEGKAYVLTAAALKDEMSSFYKEFQSAFRSLTLSSDLVGNIPQLERREKLKEKEQQLLKATLDSLSADKSTSSKTSPFDSQLWLSFQQMIIDDFKDMGAHWQILLLHGAREKILSLKAQHERTHVHPKHAPS